MNIKKMLPFLVLTFVLAVIFSDNAFASSNQIGNANIISTVMKNFKAHASAWGGIILGFTAQLFFGLAVISVTYTSGMMYLRGVDFNGLFSYILKTFFVLGFFYWCLLHGLEIGEAIITSLVNIGERATGTSNISTGSFMDMGFDIFANIVNSFSMANLANSFIMGICGLAILLIFALISVNLVIEYCAAWVLLYAGCIFLGFGSSDLTRDMTISYLKALLASGIRLMSMILIMGVATAVIGSAMEVSKQPLNHIDTGVILVTGVIILSLMTKIPNMLGGIVGGSIGQSSGNMGAGAAMATAGIASAVGGAVGSMAGGVASKTGLASAAMAGLGGSGGGSMANSAGSAMKSNSFFNDDSNKFTPSNFQKKFSSGFDGVPVEPDGAKYHAQFLGNETPPKQELASDYSGKKQTDYMGRMASNLKTLADEIEK